VPTDEIAFDRARRPERQMTRSAADRKEVGI
jgi:hypothetical protein